MTGFIKEYQGNWAVEIRKINQGTEENKVVNLRYNSLSKKKPYDSSGLFLPIYR